MLERLHPPPTSMAVSFRFSALAFTSAAVNFFCTLASLGTFSDWGLLGSLALRALLFFLGASSASASSSLSCSP